MSIKPPSKYTLTEFFAVRRLWVPDYQREYSWEVALELDDFWRDILSLKNDEDYRLFLGQFVVHRPDETKPEHFLIDGQQRTATILIMASVFLNYLYYLYTEYEITYALQEATRVKNSFIGEYNNIAELEILRNNLKLYLGGRDKDFFQNNIMLNEDPQRYKEHIEVPRNSASNARIAKAYNFLYEKLSEAADDNSREAGIAKLRKVMPFLDAFKERIELIYVETGEESDAYVIFEALNARGRELAISDLLKNFLFQHSGGHLGMVQSNWENMLAELGKEKPSTFVRHYWNSFMTFAREKELYRAIRRAVATNEITPHDISDNLKYLAPYYSAVSSPDDDGSLFEDKKIKNSLQHLSIMKTSSFTPIVLAMLLSTYNNDQISRVLAAIETLAFRNFMVANRVANKYETLFAEIATELSLSRNPSRRASGSEDFIREENCVNAIEKIKENTLGDEEFSDLFAYYKPSNNKMARMLLKEYNAYKYPPTDEVLLTDDNYSLHVEHIMPKTLSEEWHQTISKDDHETFVGYIGNLTLLGASINIPAGNNTFQEKKDRFYSRSMIDITRKELCEYTEWGVEEIKDRQKKIAEAVINIWRK